MRTSLGLLVPLVLLASGACGPDGEATAAPEVGRRLPPLRLPTLDGGTLDLRRLHGQRVLLIEFASW